MDLEQQHTSNTHVTHVDNLFWKKLYSRNYVPVLCVIFLIIFVEYGIIYQFSEDGDLENKQTSIASNLHQLITVLKSYYGLAMPIKPVDNNTNTMY